MIINYNGKDVRLPDFLIVGAAKSGTTSLHYYLKQHPQIFMPVKKELYFFVYTGMPEEEIPKWLIEDHNIPLTVDDYSYCLKDALHGQIIGEACTGYLTIYERTIANIRKVYKDKRGDIKIIIILRNPIERAWSQYTMNLTNGAEPLGFMAAIKPDVVRQRMAERWDEGFDYIAGGMYFQQVGSYMAEFQHVKVFLYEDLANEPQKLVEEIFGFLGVDRGFIPDMKVKYNVSGESSSKVLDYLVAKDNFAKGLLKKVLPYEFRRKMKFAVLDRMLQKERIPENVKKELQKIYRDDILRLESLLKRDISAWLA